MKKAIVLFSVLFVLLFAASVCSAEETFTVGFDQEFPPYGFVNDKGEFDGYDLNFAAEVAKRNGWKIVYQPIDWDAKDMELDSGTIDCIWNGFTMSDERLNQYTWTKPYQDNSQIFIVKAGSGITTFDDLKGKSITTQADSSALDALQNDENKDLLNSFKELVTIPDYNTAFMNLEAGSTDAIAMDINVAKFQIQGRENEFKILDQVLSPELYAVGFKLGNTELRDKVQKTIDEMVADGTCKKLSEKWFNGEDTCIYSK